MKIAQIAPLEEAVPPKLYGGTERVVAYLTDALVDLGHEVTLFASGDSETKANLVATWPRALRLDPELKDHLAPLHLHLETMARRADDFDILHSHIDYVAFSLLRRARVPSVTTLHGRLDLPELAPLYTLYDDMNLVSISDFQRRPLPHAAFTKTVLHGLPKNLLDCGEGRGGYAAFLGRMSPEKGPDAAIRIARAVGCPLKMAAKIGFEDAEYYQAVVEPLLSGDRVEFVGEIREPEKSEFLGNAVALLFPIAWPEPFGLVMIEAMACGTPVIAYDNGSVSEIIEDGVTGFIVRSEAEAIRALQRVESLDRRRIRTEFERRFTAEQMALNYLALYRNLCQQERAPAANPLPDVLSSLRTPLCEPDVLVPSFA